MVTNSRKVKITCGNDEFVVKGVVFDKDGVLTEALTFGNRYSIFI